MKVFLDDVPIDVPRPSLAMALEVAAREAERHGRMIVRIEADGTVVPDAELTAPSDEPGRFAELRFHSAEPVTMVQDAFQHAAEVLDSLVPEQQSAMEMLQTGRGEAAFGQIRRIVDGWQGVADVMGKGLALLRIDPAQVDVKDHDHPDRSGSLADAVRALLGDLETLRVSIAHDDSAALADVLGHELDRHARVFGMLLRALASQISAQRE